MTYTPTQIELIKTFWKKELSEGCKVICNDESIKTVLENSEFWFYIQPNWISDGYICYENEDIEMWISEILWHIPEIFPDVAREILNKFQKDSIISVSEWKINFCLWKWGMHEIPYNPTLSLIDQEESTLVQLLNLFK